MEHGAALKIIGVIVCLAGLLLSAFPELVSNKPVPDDPFQAVERRVWWGLLIGLGILFVIHRQIAPWQFTLAATGSTLVFGILVARCLGIALDGSSVKQWFWVAVEVVILMPLAYWYIKQRP